MKRHLTKDAHNTMRRSFFQTRLWITTAVITASALGASVADDSIPVATLSDAALSADTILDDVIKQLPQQKVTISGRLRSYTKSARPQHRAGNGLSGNTYQTRIILDWGATPPTAQYDVLSRKHDLLESMTLRRLPDGSTQTAYTAGPERSPTKAPAINKRIQSTNLSWADLSLSFLWWRGATITGQDRVKGRTCLVITVEAPQQNDVDYHHMKLWIDSTYHVLMRAEGYDKQNQIQRRMEVKTLKKFEDQWMIKDLQIENLPSRFRTVLTIDELLINAPVEKESSPPGP